MPATGLKKVGTGQQRAEKARNFEKIQLGFDVIMWFEILLVFILFKVKKTRVVLFWVLFVPLAPTVQCYFSIIYIPLYTIVLIFSISF